MRSRRERQNYLGASLVVYVMLLHIRETPERNRSVRSFPLYNFGRSPSGKVGLNPLIRDWIQNGVGNLPASAWKEWRPREIRTTDLLCS